MLAQLDEKMREIGDEPEHVPGQFPIHRDPETTWKAARTKIEYALEYCPCYFIFLVLPRSI